MKKIMTALVAAILMSSAALAQDNEKKGNRPQKFDKTEMVQKRTDEVVKKYGLSDAQAKQLLELNTQYADKMGGPGHGPRGQRHGRPGMGPRNGGNNAEGWQGKRPELTDEQKAKMEEGRKQAEENMKAYDAELQKILTPEQYKSYKADRNDRQDRGPRGQRPSRKENRNN